MRRWHDTQRTRCTANATSWSAMESGDEGTTSACTRTARAARPGSTSSTSVRSAVALRGSMRSTKIPRVNVGTVEPTLTQNPAGVMQCDRRAARAASLGPSTLPARQRDALNSASCCRSSWSASHASASTDSSCARNCASAAGPSCIGGDGAAAAESATALPACGADADAAAAGLGTVHGAPGRTAAAIGDGSASSACARSHPVRPVSSPAAAPRTSATRRAAPAGVRSSLSLSLNALTANCAPRLRPSSTLPRGESEVSRNGES